MAPTRMGRECHHEHREEDRDQQERKPGDPEVGWSHGCHPQSPGPDAEEQEEKEAPYGPARTVAEPPDKNRDGRHRKDEREQEWADQGAVGSLAAGVATSLSTRRTSQRSHPATRAAAAPTSNQWCRFITRSLPRGVDPELDQVHVGTHIARDHAERGPRTRG